MVRNMVMVGAFPRRSPNPTGHLLRRDAGYTGLGIGAERVDALKCRFPQENGTLHAAEFLTLIPNPF